MRSHILLYSIGRTTVAAIQKKKANLCLVHAEKLSYIKFVMKTSENVISSHKDVLVR